MTAAARDHDRTLIDWLTITHDDRAHLATCLRGPTERRNGVHAYRTAVQDGYGTILASDGPQPRPYMLRMTGAPLQAWRAERSIRDLVLHLTSQPVVCTRLDLARDTSGLWTPYRLRDCIEADRYVANWRTVTYHSGKGNSALTVQLGSRASSSLLRVYDKKAEREAAGEDCPFDRLSRWELQLNKPLSTRALRRIAELQLAIDTETGVETWPLRRLHSAWLGDRLRITVAPVDRDGNNQSHASTLPAWEAFLAEREDDILAPELDERGPEVLVMEAAQWFVRSCATTLALIHELGGDELVGAVIDRGRRRRRSAKHALIAENAETTLPALRSAIVGD